MTSFNISAWAIRHQALVLFAIIALAVAGAQSFLSLGRSEDPDFTIKTMVVSAAWPGATAREVELQVTDELEKVLQQIPWFDNVTSYSRPGEAVLMVTLRDDMPKSAVADTWYQVRKRITDNRGVLPQGVAGPFFNDEFGDTFGNVYAFTADGFSPTELRHIVDEARQRLLRVRDVAKVEMIGEQDDRIFVEFSHQRLATLGVTTNQVLQSLQGQTSVSPSGVMETPTERVALRIASTARGRETIADLPITVDGRTFKLGDVASVSMGTEDPPSQLMRLNGKPVIGLAVSMATGGNIESLGASLSAEMERIRADLPAGIEMEQIANQPRVVEESLAEFFTSLVEALAIVLAVSLLSLGFRTGLVVALCVPLVLAITFVVMGIGDIGLHRISLGALIIALGLLVDDAIIAVEMMMVKLEEGASRAEAASYAYTATAFPMLTGTLVTAAGFIPVGFAKSGAGEYTNAMFWVVGISLIASWITAVLFTPYLGYHMLPQPKPAAHGKAHDIYNTRVYTAFRRALNWCVDKRWAVIGAAVGAFFISIVAFGAFVPQQFFPSSNRPELIATLRLPGGSSIAATQMAAQRMEDVLANDPDVDYYTVYVGVGSPRFYLPLKVELGDATLTEAVIMTKGGEARERVITRLQTLLDTEWTDLSGRISRLELGPPVGYPVQFRILGSDPQEIRRIAAAAGDIVRANPHTRDVNFDWGEMSKQVTLEIDRTRAGALGLTPEALAEPLNTLLSGAAVAEVRNGKDIIPVVARALPAERLNLDDLAGINISLTDPATGKPRSLSVDQIATLKFGFEEPVLWRRNRETMMLVRADIGDGTMPPVVSGQINQELDALRATLPAGYRIEPAGVSEESAKSQASINAMMPLMLVVMLAVLMVQLQSFSRLALVVVTAPLGMIGVTIALILFQQPFGFVATLGVIALAGMIMRNTVILVDQIDKGIAQGLAARQAIIEATVHRARPVLLTAAAAILAMIPLTRSVFWGPMAVAIMGGLAVATVLTLMVVPALYAAWFKVQKAA